MVNKKPAGKRAPCCGAERLERLDVRRLQAFGAALHFELDLLAFLQRLEAVHLDRGVMREQIFAAFSRGDEAEAFGVVEPLDGTGRHLHLPSTGKSRQIRARRSRARRSKKGTDGHYGRCFWRRERGTNSLLDILRAGSYHLFFGLRRGPSCSARGTAVWYLTCLSAKLDLMLPTPGTRDRKSRMNRSNAGTSGTSTRS